MNPKFSPFDTTLWHATAIPAPRTDRLEETITADVCVVGGGYTGMTTALELVGDGASIVVLESQEMGFGGSGRNAGHCTPTFSYYALDELRAMLGQERAERLIARQVSGADMAADLIRDYQIDCEWQQNGYFQGALTPSKLHELENIASSYAEVGAPSAMIGSAEAEKLTGSSRFYGAWLLKSGGHLNPLSYARGIAKALIQEGAQVLTDSKVIDVTPHKGAWSVNTKKGAVIADKVVMCTGAYTEDAWKGLDRTFKIQKVFLAATNPLPDAVREKVLPFNGTMHDGREDFFVYKYDRAGRIIVSMFPMGKRGRDLDYTRQVLLDRLRWLHPQVPVATTWDYYWTGELDMQRQTIPRLYDVAPGVIACTGLSGRGVPTGTMLGGIIADWARGVPEKDLALPLEKLKFAPAYMNLAPAMVLRWYRLRDRLAAKRDGAELPPHA